MEQRDWEEDHVYKNSNFHRGPDDISGALDRLFPEFYQ
jgi:hypothetical protein